MPKQKPMHDQSTTTLVRTLRCQECERPWLDDHERWRMYVAPDDVATAPLLYCPACAGREFDAD